MQDREEIIGIIQGIGFLPMALIPVIGFFVPMTVLLWVFGIGVGLRWLSMILKLTILTKDTRRKKYGATKEFGSDTWV